ncbi:hypothetical protein N7468_002409 [Penicillium chermesinum]|uniref:Sfi1 spindle body domain-containing protein n=1 Tax=Penicillium chermesinum TaxID=63820 RepID=A0A9W9PIG0_9EURO|nr:uncharacterized protein N7468_002409 [Penicillium chermesinum]KAJ5247426.1 hypothetical protein N7468_002409 [Penicillium chermesinum]
MPQISPQQRASTEEIPSLSDEDVGFLYQVVTRAESKPIAEQLPFRALFAAYDDVIQEHGLDADPGHVCMRFLFKMGGKGVEGATLFDKFESALQQIGIVVEFGDDGTTGVNETLENGVSSVENTFNQTQNRDYPRANGTPITPKRRASFNTTLDIGEDASHRSHVERPSSRSSLSRLQTAKSEFNKPKLSPTPATNGYRETRSPDRTQLIAQFLAVGRQLISKFDNDENKENKDPALLTNGLMARTAVDQDRSRRMMASAQARRTPSVVSSGSSQSDGSRTNLADLLRDASTFNMYRQRAICRKIVIQWLKRAFQMRQLREKRESIAITRDRTTLLRQAFEPWRAIIQKKHHQARTERFFKHLDERANRARDLYLMTKAFTHWAQLTSEEAARTSAARRHVLSIKYFNAWREITAVNELKAQRFGLRAPFKKWRKKAAQLKEAESQAITIHAQKLKHASYWEWFWGFCDRRAPEWYASSLKRRSLLAWLRKFRTNREQYQEIAIQDRRSVLGFVVETWSQKTKDVTAMMQHAQESRRQRLLREMFGELKVQSRLAPAASQIVDKANTRRLRSALSKWKSKAGMVDQAIEVDQLRVKHNAWTSWNDTLRCLALRARVNERMKMEVMYKWILMERFQLMRRIHEQRIKREVFVRFVDNTRDTYTRLLFQAEAHEGHREEDLARSKLSLWRDRLQLQRERDYVAFEFYAPRLAEESLTAWRSKHQQIQKMEGWADDARFYFLMKASLKNWRRATIESTKQRRKDAYAKIRRKIKINMASKALSIWHSKTSHIMNMEQQAEDVDRAQVLSDASDAFSLWHKKTMKRIQDYQDADLHFFHRVAFDQLIQLSEAFVIRREMEDQADAMYRSHVLRHAGAAFRKLSLRIFQLRSTLETSEALRERTIRKHARNYFHHWLESSRLKLEARDSPGPELTQTNFSQYGEIDPPRSALFDPWYQNPSEKTPFRLANSTTRPQEPVSVTPLVTPNNMSSPSKRAARARALAQMSTTPATPLHTPFASRLLRASSSTRNTSPRQPLTSRGNSIAASVRFADEELEELPESPTDGRKSASRRP